MSRLFVPLATAYVFFWGILYFEGSTISFAEILSRILSFNPFLPYSWYVTEILIFYMSFYVIGKLVNNPKQVLCWMTILILLFILIGRIFMLPSYLFCSTFCFIVGMFYMLYEKAIYDWLRNKKILLLWLCGLFFCLFNWVRFYNILRIDMLMKYSDIYPYLGNILFVILLVFAMQNIHIYIRKSYLFHSYYEIYLNQAAIFALVTIGCENRWLIIFMGMIGSIILSPIIYRINKYLVGRIKI